MTSYLSANIATLNDISMDALREVGNIGLGNAMTALSVMLDQGVNMSIPRVGLVPLSEFALMVGGDESLSVCIYMPVTADVPGHVAFLLPEPGARQLADRLLGQPVGTTQYLDDLERSVLMEVGNIVASSYLVAICEMTGLALHSSPPAIAVDMTAAILASLALVFADHEDQVLTILTHIGDELSPIEGFFLYVPEPESLPVLLRALGLEETL